MISVDVLLIVETETEISSHESEDSSLVCQYCSVLLLDYFASLVIVSDNWALFILNLAYDILLGLNVINEGYKVRPMIFSCWGWFNSPK